MPKRANGEGSIYRRRDGRYCAALLVDGRRRMVYGATRDEVNKRLTTLVKAREDGAALPVGRQTVAAFALVWLEGTRSTLRPRTWERYEQFVRIHITPAIGGVPLQRLQPQQLQQLYQRLLGAGYRPATVHQMHAVIHRCLHQAVRWNLVARNVADLVDPPRIRREQMAVLNALEARRLLEAARDTRWEALLTVALTTGMRLGELLALRWHDVDCDRAALSVTATVQRTRSDGLVLAEPKTSKSRRRVALTAGAVEALRRHRVGQAAERLQAPDWSELDLVFPNRLGRYQEPTRMAYEYRKLLTAAGLPRIRFHDLRHTAATLMLARGVHPKVASEMLGHSSIGITLDLYSHVTESMQREAAASLDQLLWS